jgi:hypothetical protein
VRPPALVFHARVPGQDVNAAIVAAHHRGGAMNKKGMSQRLIQDLRRAAQQKGDKKRGQASLAPILDQLTDLQLFTLWEQISTGAMTNVGSVRLLKNKWKKFEKKPDELVEKVVGRFIAAAKEELNREDALALSSRVKSLQVNVRKLENKQAELERQIVEEFNPLFEIASLSAIQKSRIAKFATAEAEDEKPNKELDSMIDKQRQLIESFVRSMRDLRFNTEGRERPPGVQEKHLHQTHIHLQNQIDQPKVMVTVIDNFASDLEDLAVPVPAAGQEFPREAKMEISQ